MTPNFFISAVFFVFILQLTTSQPAENIISTDASMIEEMAKMVLTQFSSIVSPKTLAKIPSNPSKATSTTPAPSNTGEKVRQCTCSESDECIAEAYRSSSFCQTSCKSHLEYYSSHANEFLTCLPKNPAGHFILSKCLKENIPQFCAASDSSRVPFIPKPNYFNQTSSSTFELNFDLGKQVVDMVILEHLKTFFACSGTCMKEKILGCYNRKSCGVFLPPNHDLGNIESFCSTLKSSINFNLMKALPCFAMQQVFPKFIY